MSALRYEGPATIVAADGSSAAIDALYWIDPQTESSIGSWNGVFTVTAGHLEPGDAELRLPDERVGRIVVTKVDLRFDGSREGGSKGRFLGAGPPPV